MREGDSVGTVQDQAHRAWGSEGVRGEGIARQTDEPKSIVAPKIVHSLVFLVVGEKGQEPLHTPKKKLGFYVNISALSCSTIIIYSI